MIENVEISCITKRDRYNPHERIEGVGGTHNGGRWWLSEDDAIAGAGVKWNFFVSVGDRRVAVVIASHNGRKYLKTVADGYEPNNLLSLNACPVAGSQ